MPAITLASSSEPVSVVGSSGNSGVDTCATVALRNRRAYTDGTTTSVVSSTLR